MMKKILSIIILSGLVFIFPVSHAGWSASSLSVDDYYNALAPNKEHPKTAQEILRELQAHHYRKLTVDDQLSRRLFDQYCELLDPARSYLCAQDVSDFEAYRFQFDDMLKLGTLDPAFTMYNRYQKRRIGRYIFLINHLQQGLQGIKLDDDETLKINRKKSPWPACPAEFDDLWRKRLEESVLSLKLAEKPTDEISELLITRYRNALNQIHQTKSEDVFEIYMNALAQVYDPHTQYLPPRAYENFNINMSLSLEGIGVLLQNENEYTKIVRLIPGGPSDMGKLLKPSDLIIGVGQGSDGEIVDVVGWRLDDVVQLIRGPKGSVVRLEVIPADAGDPHQTKIVEIVRNKVKLEEQATQKRIIKIQRGGCVKNIGVIEIPAIYLDFDALRAGDPDYKSMSRDAERLLKELVSENVECVIVDMRNNGGGLLQEVVALAGLFIKKGPIVQIRNAQGSIETLNDPDPEIAYTGPLAILVNRASASASEIFAGAMQDYGRGIIIGEQTFGKGTVQSLLPLPNHGQLKITMAKYYRISGESTQHKGIIPDIYYPSQYDKEKIGESALPGALPWDTIDSSSYITYHNFMNIIPALRERHESRMHSNPDYLYLREKIKHLEKIRGKTEISLNESIRRKEKSDAETWRLALENKYRAAKNLKPMEKFADLEAEETKKQEEGAADEDPLVIEAGHILLDLVSFLSQNKKFSNERGTSGALIREWLNILKTFDVYGNK
ncbi:MAG: carboxy terminal-processing peptidase [bacterium]